VIEHKAGQGVLHTAYHFQTTQKPNTTISSSESPVCLQATMSLLTSTTSCKHTCIHKKISVENHLYTTINPSIYFHVPKISAKKPKTRNKNKTNHAC
jgi:hypothetical protein